MFKSIIKIAKHQAFSELAVLNPPLFNFKPFNGIYIFGQLNGILGVETPHWGNTTLRSRKLGSRKGMTTKFLPDVGTHKEEQNQNTCFDATGPVCKLQTKVPKNSIFGNATSRCANFTKFSRIVKIDLKNKS